MHLVIDGRMWENDSFSIINRNVAASLYRLGFDVRIEAWKQGFDKAYPFLDQSLLYSLAVEPKDYDNAVTVRQSWPICEPYYSPHYNWDSIPGKVKIGLLPWESEHLPDRWLAPMSRVNAIMAISPFSAARIGAELYRHSIETPVWSVPLGVDRRLFNPDKTPIGHLEALGAKSFRFLHVGVGQHRKGSDLLRAAYFTEFTDKDDVTLIVKTGGWDSIEAWIPPSGGPQVIALHDDNIPEEDLGGYYTACHCLVHPSRLEGFGMTMLEAMACGCLVICPEEGSHTVFANDRNSIMVRGEEEDFSFFEDLITKAYRVDIADLRRAMRSVYDQQFTMSQALAGMETAKSFSWNATAIHLATLIEERFGNLERGDDRGA